MLPVDRIRYSLTEARKRLRKPRLAKTVTRLLADAMCEERRNTGAATEANLARRYGFKPEELAAYGQRAIDIATERYVPAGLDPATG